jgi:hypothetical protein
MRCCFGCIYLGYDTVTPTFLTRITVIVSEQTESEDLWLGLFSWEAGIVMS